MSRPLRKKRKEDSGDANMMVEDETKPKPNVVQAVLNESEHSESLFNSEPNEENDKKIILDLVKNEPDNDETEYAQSLPSEWKVETVKVGFGSMIKNLVDANGKKYISRIDAIRALSKLADRQDDVDILRCGLVADGWFTHQLLPQGWFAKPGNKSLKFFTKKNEWFVGIRKAVKMMENSEDYTGAENLQTFYNQYSSIKRSNDDSWIDDEENLPEGWRYKIYHGPKGDYAKLLAPNGELFPSKRKALAFMVKNGSKEADIVKMRSALGSEGWVETNFLPLDWRYRKCKTGRNEYNFLSPAGEVFPSRKILVKFLQSNEEYTEEDIANVDALQDEIRAKWIHGKQNWIEDDESVPSGWKIRYFDGVKANKKPRRRYYILSPCGSTFQSRAKALQFMIRNKYPEDQISYMFIQLEREGWICHTGLPLNWRIKQKLKEGHVFFTSEGLILNLKNALRHIEQFPEKYSGEESDGLVFVVKGFAQQRTEDSYVWLENDSVPHGWKVREEPCSGSKREYFQIPGGKEIGGRVKAIQFLLNQGRLLNDSDVATLRGGLGNVGWFQDLDILPPGWMKKAIFNKQGKFKYISPELKEFHSLGVVYHYMRANSFPSDDINKVKQHLDIRSMLTNKKMSKKGNVTYEWKESDVVPPGWKVAERNFRYFKRLIYLSPCGLLLQKTVLAFQLMVEQRVEYLYLEQMYKQLKHEGWEEDLDLPLGWRYNVDPNQFPDSLSAEEEEGVLFLTESGKILTKNEAWKLFRDSRYYTKEQLSNFLVLLDKLRNGFDKSWAEDESLPDGWMIKEINFSYKKDHQVLSPDNEEFESFLSAFIHMNNNKEVFDDEAIMKMKSKLTEEGFEEDSRLPLGWLIVRNRKENLFELLSKEGVLYQTLDAAQEFMESSDEYNDEHILNLEDLCMSEVEYYLSSRGSTSPNFARFVPGLGPSETITKVKFKVGETKSKKRKCAG